MNATLPYIFDLFYSYRLKKIAFISGFLVISHTKRTFRCYLHMQNTEMGNKQSVGVTRGVSSVCGCVNRTDMDHRTWRSKVHHQGLLPQSTHCCLRGDRVGVCVGV